ncbi:MAG TPA: O-methyltransferase [Thermoplasmata archaeon]|nr:O-methyltransferase [Thermoplasmata archaeon]
MTEPSWEHVDAYFESHLLLPDPVLDACLRASAEAHLPSIQVSPSQGKLLHLLARAIGARRILEIGTLGGYSTIWLARALPEGGRLISLELDPKHAEVARTNVARAGLDARVEIRVGRAIDSLPKLAAQGAGPFDLVFVDADKPSTRAYFEWARRLSRPGALIVVDNVVRKGELANAASTDANVRGMREFVESLASDKGVSATGIQTVGTKGYDGFLLAWVEEGVGQAGASQPAPTKRPAGRRAR